MENRLQKFGADDGTYVVLQPADHTGACCRVVNRPCSGSNLALARYLVLLKGIEAWLVAVPDA